MLDNHVLDKKNICICLCNYREHKEHKAFHPLKNSLDINTYTSLAAQEPSRFFFIIFHEN